jgi:hypothetical protein
MLVHDHDQTVDSRCEQVGWRYLYGLICRDLCMDFNFKSIQKY